MKLVIATREPGELREFEALSSVEKWLELQPLPDDFVFDEKGTTFFERAKQKALKAARLTGILSLADDTGLVVEALNGRPGVNSSRYCEGSDVDRQERVLKEMEKVKENERHASYFCAMVLAGPDGSLAFNTIRCWEGMISLQARGSGGSYDPIFFLPRYKLSSAELTLEEKNRISHRGQAWIQVIKFLRAQQGFAG